MGLHDSEPPTRLILSTCHDWISVGWSYPTEVCFDARALTPPVVPQPEGEL